MEKNRPIYRYFAYLFLSIGLFLFASCRADDFAAPPSSEENAAVFELNLPQVELAAGRSRAAAVSRINLIQTLDVLAFDADGLFYTHCQAEELYSVDGGGSGFTGFHWQKMKRKACVSCSSPICMTRWFEPCRKGASQRKTNCIAR